MLGSCHLRSRASGVGRFGFALCILPRDTASSAMRKTAWLGFFIGVVLGCLFGAVMGVAPGGDDRPQQEMLSVNANTGKPQLHIKGKPEIK